jgi:hypothetical protein
MLGAKHRNVPAFPRRRFQQDEKARMSTVIASVYGYLKVNNVAGGVDDINLASSNRRGEQFRLQSGTMRFRFHANPEPEFQIQQPPNAVAVISASCPLLLEQAL